jgi:anti-anti-sigma factor
MTTEDASVAVIQPTGDIVAASVPELRSRMRGAIAGGAHKLTIDLRNVEMIDSVGLGMLIAAHNSLTRVGGELSAVNASEELIDLFVAMRIHQHFRVSGVGEPGDSVVGA